MAQEETVAVDGNVTPGYESKFSIFNGTNIMMKNIKIHNSTYGDGGKFRCGLMVATASAHAFHTVVRKYYCLLRQTFMYFLE